MLISRTRFTFATGAAVLALLALPSLAGAMTGNDPELVQRSGRLVVVHADRQDGTSTRRLTLVEGTNQLPVRAPADLWIEPGTPVRLQGTIRNGALVLADSLSAVVKTGPSPLAAPVAPAGKGLAAAPTMRSTAVILLGFSGAGPDKNALPTDQNGARMLMFDDPTTSLNAYYREQTYDQIGFSGDVFAPVNIAGPAGTCTISDLYAWASQAEAAVGVNDSSYQHYVFVLPDVSACNFAGIAEVGGSHVWINGDFVVPVVAHELGHNLGLAHAGGLQCSNAGTAVPISSNCTATGLEYKDPFDAMGQSDAGGGNLVLRQMSMQHKLELGLLPTASVQTVTLSGTYTLAPMELTPGSVELLRVPKAGGGSYYIEYRRPIGWFDSQPPAFDGVYIRTENPEVAQNPSNPNADTALIDMHPSLGSSASWTDARMDVGQVFNDAVAGILVQNAGQDANGATLAITLPVNTSPPGRPGNLTATPGATSVALHWTPATDDQGVASYRVTREGALVGAPAGTDFTDTGLAPQSTVAYTVSAVDTSGNIGAAASISVTLPDAEAPSTPSKVTVTITKDQQVRITWGPSTDNGRLLGYQVLRNGTLIGAGNITAFVDNAAKAVKGDAINYSVVALDFGGNVSQPGKAAPLRTVLLRKLSLAHVKVVRVKHGKRKLVRVKGTVSDAKAVCRVRVGAGPWHPCKAKATGAFSVSLRASGRKPVTVSLRDELGRVKLQTLRVR